MKLISMVDFVLQRESKHSHQNTFGYQRFTNEVCDYANFLNQPLTLGMFVPCDEEGNVLEMPVPFKDMDKHRQYQQAKDRVMFEGWNISNETKVSITVSCDRERFLNWIKKKQEFFMHSGNKVEYFVQFGFELTPSAIKQLGL